MKRAVLSFCALLLSLFLFIGCGEAGDDGVVIIPSSRGESVGTGTCAIEETAPETEAVTEAETEAITESASLAETETAAVTGEDVMLDNAEALLDDAAFLAHLEKYGIDVSDGDVVGIVAAVLAYKNEEITRPTSVNGAAASAVYWTEGGSVWHVTRECSALAKSKGICSGSTADAMANGKTRACKRCAE